LTNEFATAPTDKSLILALHHPVYSFDDHHSGSPHMADAVQQAINDSRRVPNMVLAAHVHNYQRIERALVKPAKTPFLVIGNGGYFHMHGMNASDGTQDPNTKATLIKSNHTNHGYATLTVDAKNISGTVTTIDTTKTKGQAGVDTFSYPGEAMTLAAGDMVSL
jgi:hypothetical protein